MLQTWDRKSPVASGKSCGINFSIIDDQKRLILPSVAGSAALTPSVRFPWMTRNERRFLHTIERARSTDITSSFSPGWIVQLSLVSGVKTLPYRAGDAARSFMQTIWKRTMSNVTGDFTAEESSQKTSATVSSFTHGPWVERDAFPWSQISSSEPTLALLEEFADRLSSQSVSEVGRACWIPPAAPSIDFLRSQVNLPYPPRCPLHAARVD
jgi:hypothetical protein